ncbi:MULTISPECIES: DMT family transporter [Nostocales]|uniref:DMT family transporter n=3 Tax=Nostocales TaxID=1161 RepID=A0A8S9T6Q7_9CYAN|nr:DMT family transporter [Tolypothrix bouteillei]KAF3888150.1 DMT family transporter [Tolypothrix bouteillei VB521301]
MTVLNDCNQPTQKGLHALGVILLVAASLIWGTTFPLIKNAIGSLSPSAILASRFVVAAVVLAPYLRCLNAKLIRDGCLLGLVLFASFATQTMALQTIHANRAAFISSLTVVIVPLLGLLIGQRVLLKTLLAAGVAITGIGVMSWESGQLSVGDFLLFGNAFIYAVYILILEKTTQRHPTLSLTAVQVWVIAVLGMLWATPELVREIHAIGTNINAVLYLGLVATAATVLIETMSQRWVSAQEAALFYTLDPVFSAVISFLLLGETLGVRGLIGATLVLAAMVLSQGGKDTQDNTEIETLCLPFESSDDSHLSPLTISLHPETRQLVELGKD